MPSTTLNAFCDVVALSAATAWVVAMFLLNASTNSFVCLDSLLAFVPMIVDTIVPTANTAATAASESVFLSFIQPLNDVSPFLPLFFTVLSADGC